MCAYTRNLFRLLCYFLLGSHNTASQCTTTSKYNFSNAAAYSFNSLASYKLEGLQVLLQLCYQSSSQLNTASYTELHFKKLNSLA